MAGVEDIITQVGWNSDSSRVKVELVNGIHEEVKPWIALEGLSNVDVNYDINEGTFSNKHECSACKRAFSSKSKLARHKKVHGENWPGKKGARCELAGKKGAR